MSTLAGVCTQTLIERHTYLKESLSEGKERLATEREEGGWGCIRLFTRIRSRGLSAQGVPQVSR